mmetsp:Transcript_2900/g.7876  ORF Transcript_2900/g.7876 Transcript_2900/m.7876 type:complete len:235 (-) Transcript_2900:349-1053(-)
MPREPGVVHLLDQGVARQEYGDLLCVLGLLLHPESHGLQPPQGQPALERRHHVALRVLVEVNLLAELLADDREDPSGHVRVPRDELCRRRHRDVRSQINRPLKDGRHDGVIHADHGSILLGHLADGRDVANLEPWVRGRLDQYQLHRRLAIPLGSLLQGGLHLLHLRHVDVLHRQSLLRGSYLSQEPLGSAIDVVPRQDALPWLHKPHHRRDGRHAARESKRSISVLDVCHLIL